MASGAGSQAVGFQDCRGLVDFVWPAPCIVRDEDKGNEMSAKRLMWVTFVFGLLTLASLGLMEVLYRIPGSAWPIMFAPMAQGLWFTFKYGRQWIAADAQEHNSKTGA